jgi:hypothetical protein
MVPNIICSILYRQLKGAVPLPKLLRMPKRSAKRRKSTTLPPDAGEKSQEKIVKLPVPSSGSDAEARWLKLGDEALGNNHTLRKKA